MPSDDPHERKANAKTAFRRKVTYFKNRPGSKLQEGMGLTIAEMDAVLAESGLSPVTDEDLRRWQRKRQ